MENGAAMTSGSRVVFLPNRPTSRDEPDYRIKQVRRGAKRGRLRQWTCSKTVEPGDVYLFWFGEHVRRIEALGVAAGNKKEEENGGQCDWTSARRLWFCDYQPVIQLMRPITIDDITSSSLLRKWWQGKPYRGRPKRLAPDVAEALTHVAMHAALAHKVLKSRSMNKAARL